MTPEPETHLRSRILARELLLGVFLDLGSPVTAEIVAGTGVRLDRARRRARRARDGAAVRPAAGRLGKRGGAVRARALAALGARRLGAGRRRGGRRRAALGDRRGRARGGRGDALRAGPRRRAGRARRALRPRLRLCPDRRRAPRPDGPDRDGARARGGRRDRRDRWRRRAVPRAGRPRPLARPRPVPAPTTRRSSRRRSGSRSRPPRTSGLPASTSTTPITPPPTARSASRSSLGHRGADLPRRCGRAPRAARAQCRRVVGGGAEPGLRAATRPPPARLREADSQRSGSPPSRRTTPVTSRWRRWHSVSGSHQLAFNAVIGSPYSSGTTSYAVIGPRSATISRTRARRCPTSARLASMCAATSVNVRAWPARHSRASRRLHDVERVQELADRVVRPAVVEVQRHAPEQVVAGDQDAPLDLVQADVRRRVAGRLVHGPSPEVGLDDDASTRSRSGSTSRLTP